VQNLVDLDNVAQNDEPAFGQLKLTVAQFFRVNGGSTQNKGVVPDVAFPTTFDPTEWGESAIDNALPWTSITAADYAGQGNFNELVPLLAARHEQRVSADQEFQYWVADLDEYRKLRQQKSESLLESTRRQERDALEAKQKARKAEREALAKVAADGKPAIASEEPELVLDDGLQADERPIEDESQEEESERPDVLLTESARVLSDAIDLLQGDAQLAARVKAFNVVAEAPKRIN
jgi:carboxyl-terminal processing protease